MESKNFQRSVGKMLYDCLDDPASEFAMAMVTSGMCKPTVGAMARLMRVIPHCIDRPTFSWWFKLDRPQQKLAVMVNTDHASDETTRKNMPCYHKVPVSFS